MNHTTQEAKQIGFRDGFLGFPAKNFSTLHDLLTAYLDGYSEGKSHREQVDEVAKAENIAIDDLMRKCFSYYYQTVFLPKNTVHLP